jgi:hypothetical protein
MAFAEITPQQTDYGAERKGLEEYLDVYNAQRIDQELEEIETIDQIWIDEARADVLRDLAAALDLNLGDAGDVAEIERCVEPHGLAIGYAISLKQRILWYQDTQQGAETANGRLMEMRISDYSQARRGFARMRSRRTISTTKTTTFKVIR